MIEQSQKATIYQATIKALEDIKDCIITSHINADGDALGSALGLMHLLRGRGVQVKVVMPTPVPSNMKWMPGADEILVWPVDAAMLATTVVVLDLNTISRLDALGAAITAKATSIINIDHHLEPENFASTALVDIDASSTCLIIAELAQQADWSMSAEAATCLYTGIMTDSGGFRHPRTTSALHRTVAYLIEHGADPVTIYEDMFNQSTIERQKMLGVALTSMRLEHAEQVCIMVIRAVDLSRFGATTDDIDGYVSYTLSITGVRIGIMFVELADQVKCSFRSKGTTFVRDIAASFGGGGHQYAAGARIKGISLDDAVHQVLTKVGNYLELHPPSPAVAEPASKDSAAKDSAE